MDLLNKGVLFAFALTSASGVVWAAGDSAGGAGGASAALSFEEADVDGNGAVDADEARAAGLNINEIDIDSNGQITRAEWEQAPAPAVEPAGGAQAPGGERQ